jgi:hypothetical protein
MPIPAGIRIIGDLGHAAGVAGLDVAAEHRGSASHDRGHHAPLDATEMAGMHATIGVAMPTQDIGNLQANARHSSVDGGPVRADVGTGHDPHPDAGHPGGVTSSDRRSSGLCVARIVWVETCV